MTALFELTPEFIEKAHWRYDKLVHKMTNERIEVILKYAKYDIEELATLFNVDVDTMKCYMKDFTLIPVPKLWILAGILNVWIDCFSHVAFWENLMLDEVNLPETDESQAS